MPYDPLANFVQVTVTVAPSPADSGTTLKISDADAAILDAKGLNPSTNGAFNIVCHPSIGQTVTNSEILRLTAKGSSSGGNTQYTITRTAETGSPNRSIVVGDKLTMTITKKIFTDIQTDVSSLSTIQTNLLTGWIASTDTWTRTGNYTFTVPGDKTTTYTKGTRVKYTDSTPTTDYGVVISSSYNGGTVLTTVTLATNNQYSMAAGTITSPYYSYVANPQGYPTWFTYTPTFGGFSTAPASFNYCFNIVGTMCTLYQDNAGSDGVSNDIVLTFTLPVSALRGSYNIATCYGKDAGANLAQPAHIQLSGSSATAQVGKTFYNGAWTNSSGKNVYIGTFSYEI